MDESCLDGLEAETRAEAGRTRSVPVLERAFAALELLAASSNGLTLPDVARKLQIPKSSAHCILLTLLRQGYLSRSDRTRRYVLGQKLFSLASHALAGQDVREAAMPHLRQLMMATKLTVHLGVLEGGEVILIAKVDPPGVTGLATWLGRRMDVHCTGMGKALIANLPAEDLEQFLRSRTFPRHNENTIVSAKRLKQELDTVRTNGFATDDEEDEVGYRCIGVPVLDRGRIVAAVSLAGSVIQVTNENKGELVRHLTRAAEAISHALHVGRSPVEREQKA
ncbi:MAG TPA: IclR family transcriptional regulator [Bryobacteraceae bacterium]|nr:IclR family transcriptional regulator [Bryobacteraceae bacterium]